ncbi:biliverdin-producing heme oxygenase [Mesonia aquimarina]|uniref:biliverdin-producing heme oxygenase n=1 Tax=Mesonia aquimarina TaxID=1504967 RepID=UPI001F08EC94|nr:biliverdin-producing heme oxygenase [Mesonia aquimarina]
MILDKLREATKQLHEEIEQDNLAEHIISHKISLADYKLLLLQNYIAYHVTETEIAKQLSSFAPSKAKRLEKDLAQLHISRELVKDFKNVFSCQTEAEAWGALYVVEGSALGGMLIAKNLSECKNLSEIEVHHFFDGNHKNIAGWKDFCKALKKKDFSEKETKEAIEKAKETFVFFGEVFNKTKVSSLQTQQN